MSKPDDFSLAVFHLIEDAFDSRTLPEIQERFPSFQPFHELIALVDQSDWKRVYEHATDLLNSPSISTDARSFVLQWAVAATEVEYDLEKRASFLRYWERGANWAESPYSCYLFCSMQALTSYFRGSPREAEIQFNQALEAARSASYERGIMRAIFHLGLIEAQRNSPEKASRLFREALLIAEKRKAIRFIERIHGQLRLLGEVTVPAQEATFEEGVRNIETLLSDKRFVEARRAILRLEFQRRKSRWQRKRLGLGWYLALAQSGLGRPRSAERLKRAIKDQVVLFKYLEMKQRIHGLNPQEKMELKMAQEICGVSTILRSGADSRQTEVCGIKLDTLRNTEIKKLMNLMIAHEQNMEITKEMICEQVFGLTYDPVLHDGKVYKLVRKARSVFRKSDVIENTYGGYRLKRS